jgi:glutathione S-transferase
MDNLTLYFDRAACSLGVRIALEKTGAGYNDVRIAIRKGEAQGEDYLKINPAGRVPALLIPGEDKALTELIAIHAWLDDQFPQAGLLPKGMDKFRALELLSSMATGLHANGFGPFFRPARFSPDADHQPVLSRHAVTNIAEGYRLLEERAPEQGFMFGAEPGSADYMIYIYLRWGAFTGLDMKGEFPKLMALADRVEALPQTQSALEREKLPSIHEQG